MSHGELCAGAVRRGARRSNPSRRGPWLDRRRCVRAVVLRSESPPCCKASQQSSAGLRGSGRAFAHDWVRCGSCVLARRSRPSRSISAPGLDEGEISERFHGRPAAAPGIRPRLACGTADATPPSMEAKHHSNASVAVPRYRPIAESVCDPSAPDTAPTQASAIPRAIPAERDRLLACFEWLCSGPVSEREREVTRRARWRLA
jgi:hypothetical protein